MNTDASLEFQLSDEGEQIVRSYTCTRIKPLFAPEAVGRLTVTNKRIVYHSQGKSLTGASMLVSEMPIEDSSSVGVYMGNSVNWLLLIGFALGVYIVSALYDALLPRFFTSWILGALLMLPYGIQRLFGSRWLSDDVKRQARGTLDEWAGKASVKVEANTWNTVFRWMFRVGVLIFVWAIAHSAPVRFGLPFLDLLLLAAVYALAYLAWFGREPVFALMVGSRTQQGSGIFIPGAAFTLMGNRTAIDTLSGAPAADAPTVARELGALLADLRQLGDVGAQRWQML